MQPTQKLGRESLTSEPEAPWHYPELNRNAKISEGDKYPEVPIKITPEVVEFITRIGGHIPFGLKLNQLIFIQNEFNRLSFEHEICRMENENFPFPDHLLKGPNAPLRQWVLKRWEKKTGKYQPIKVAFQDGKKRAVKHVRVLPCFHGTSRNIIRKICASGFIFFGKDEFFENKKGFLQGKKVMKSTDKGWFGSGFYFTNKIFYALKYSPENALLLTWIAMPTPYPVINDVKPPKRGCDMQLLEAKGAYGAFKGHFIPTLSLNKDPACMEYFPLNSIQKPDCDELVIFQRAQTLASFILKFEPDTLKHLSQNQYNFEQGFLASQTGTKQFKVWIEERPSRLKDQNEEGKTHFFAAVLGGQFALLKWMNDKMPGMLKEKTNEGITLLHLACIIGNTEIAKWLNNKEPKLLQEEDQQGNLPIHLAALNDHATILKNFPQMAQTLKGDFLFKLVLHPCPASIRYLMKDLKADSNFANDFSQTLLHIAAKKGLEENVKALIDSKANPNAQDKIGQTPLYLAVMERHFSVAKVLMEADPSAISLKAEDGRSVLHLAAFFNAYLIVKEILSYPQGQTLISVKDINQGLTPLHDAVKGLAEKLIIELLVDEGAEVNSLNDWGDTPLHFAGSKGEIEIAEFLISKGAKTIHNQRGDCFLDKAINQNQYEFVEHFLKITPPKDSNVDPCDEKTLLEYYCHSNYLEQIYCLLRLSEFYVQKSDDFFKSALPIHQALRIGETQFADDRILKKYLFTRLQMVEATFLKTHKELEIGIQGYYLEKQIDGLNHLKKELQKDFTTGKEKTGIPCADLLQQWHKEYCLWLAEVITVAQDSLIRAPIKFACVGTGPLVNPEFLPFQQFKLVFVVEDKSRKEIDPYFNALIQFLNLKFFNLNYWQSPFQIENHTLHSIENRFEPVDKCLRNDKEMDHLNCNLIAGDVQIFEKIQQRQNNIKKKPASLDKMNLKPFYDFSDEGIRVKKPFILNLHTILHELSVTFQLEEKSIFRILDKLKAISILTLEDSLAFQKAYVCLLGLELKMQFFRKQESEELVFCLNKDSVDGPSIDAQEFEEIKDHFENLEIFYNSAIDVINNHIKKKLY